MKKDKCRFHHYITEPINHFHGFEEILVDEVCSVDSNNPKHHNEYDCKDCKNYILDKER